LDLLEFAEKYFFISYAIVIGIGFLQGAILGRGVRNRFPSLKIHARITSISLLILFSINAIANVIKFVAPEKVSLSDLFMPLNSEEFFSILINLLGVNAGFGTIILIFISITLILFFRFADLHVIPRYFIFSISVIVVIVAIIGKFTDFVPTIFQIILYTFYQFGLTTGIFLITRRKSVDAL